MARGMVFNIQKYAVHDGPGIRTTVFLKGCPLNCWWCHNPESQMQLQQILYQEGRCLDCGNCIQICASGALKEKDRKLQRDSQACRLCGECADLCPSEALECIGQRMTVAEVMEEIIKDRVFYEESGGGVTFSGGEPLNQPEFLYQLLENCHREGIHRVVDTCGYGKWENLEEISRLTDLFLYDIKHVDDLLHQQYTGVSNKGIISNLKKLAEIHDQIQIRYPVIPNINDREEHIFKLGKMLRELGLQQISLLPYHGTGVDKYRRLEMDYLMQETAPPTAEKMQEIQRILTELGLNVMIGG